MHMANERGALGGSTLPGGRTGARPSLLAGAGNLPVLAWLIPCGLAAAYLIVFLAGLPHSIWEFNWNSDFASGFTVPESIARGGTGGHTVLGPYALYFPLWFGLLTAKLPLHRELWEIAPTLLSIAAALLLGWAVAQIATRRAAALAVLIVLIASPASLSILMAAVSHNTVYPCTALLGAYLVWLSKGDGRVRPRGIAALLLVAIVLGVCLASDLLLVPTGVLPFSLAALMACLRRDRHSRFVGLSALATVALALPIAKLTSAIMFSLGYRTNSLPLKTAPLSFLSLHLQLLLEGLERLFNGYLVTGAHGALQADVGVACDIVMALALGTLLIAGVYSAVSFMRSGLHADSQSTPTQTARALHTIYWVGSAVAACSAYALSTFLDSAHEAFYLTVVFSVAAVVPLLIGSRSPARWLVPAGVSILFAANLAGLASHPILDVRSLAYYEADVARIARANHVTNGYAGYWDASSLTWSSDEQIRARPVFACPNPAGADLCVFSQETVPSWYTPRREHSFLLVEAAESFVSSLPPGLGRPLAAYQFGPIQMYIFPYNLASQLGPPSG
jgi:hypothetical protein